MSLRPHNDGVCETAGIGFTLFHSVTFIDTYLGFHMSCRFQFNWLKKKKEEWKNTKGQDIFELMQSEDSDKQDMG